MISSRKMIFTVIVTAMLLALPSFANAQSIGVHFPSDRDNARLQPNEVAGAPGFEQGHWNSASGTWESANNFGNNNGDTTNISLPFDFGLLSDSTGTPVGTTVEWSSNGTWNTINGAATPDAKLMNGYIDAFSNFTERPDRGSTVTFNDIPYNSYAAVVYVGSDGNNRQANITDGTTTYHFLTFSNDPNGGGGFDPVTDYVLTSNTNPAIRQPANYVIFPGLSGPSQTFDINWTSGNHGIHGIQIVNTGGNPVIPEPFTASLLSLASLTLIRRRPRAA